MSIIKVNVIVTRNSMRCYERMNKEKTEPFRWAFLVNSPKNCKHWTLSWLLRSLVMKDYVLRKHVCGMFLEVLFLNLTRSQRIFFFYIYAFGRWFYLNLKYPQLSWYYQCSTYRNTLYLKIVLEEVNFIHVYELWEVECAFIILL